MLLMSFLTLLAQQWLPLPEDAALSSLLLQPWCTEAGGPCSGSDEALPWCLALRAGTWYCVLDATQLPRLDSERYDCKQTEREKNNKLVSSANSRHVMAKGPTGVDIARVGRRNCKHH